MRRIIWAAAVAILLIPLIHSGLNAEWEFDFESGAVYGGYNEVRIPNQAGTKFSLTDELALDSRIFFRGRVTWSFYEKHNLSIFVAPLRLQAEGQVAKDIFFENTTFPANAYLQAKYRFDSYRLTYRYNFYQRPDLQIGLGLSAKIRDASISLESAGQMAENTNTGFVPLINFRIDWTFAHRFGLRLEGDALAAPQGRAEDILLALNYKACEHMTFKAGYRILEGGADVDKVYTFALLHYLVAGVLISF